MYLPIYPYWLFLCARSRSFFFFAASNPSMENGGFLMESKKKIYDLLPKEYYPKTILVAHNDTREQILETVRGNHFTFPLIAKPDIGGRGRGVRKISNEEELIQYIAQMPVDMLVQEFIPYEEEIGVFYFRYPGEQKGYISGIVGKQFLTVTGDGNSTVEELLKKDKRYILQLSTLQEMFGKELKRVLPKGVQEILVPYGNHARGALFTDDTHLIDQQLEETIDMICQRIPDFYFGRLDIRFRSWQELRAGQAFSLIEVNGAGSEPTHMYDPNRSLWQAWQEIIKHWNILWRISTRNHRNGVNYLSWKDGVQMFRSARRYDRVMDEACK